MRFLRIILSVMIILALAAAAFADSGYHGSKPGPGIFVTQTRKHTCTLISATMMVRNYSDHIGNGFEHLDEHAVGKTAWSGVGLSHYFSVDGITVTVNKDIKNQADKKAYLIDTLKKYPEGVVIYDANAPHAIYLFGYDSATDTFHCADTITKNGGKAITLMESTIKGDTQQAKIDTIDRIWHIAR